MNKLKTIFMGNSDIAVPTLEKLVELTNCVAVYTNEEKTKGRGRKIALNPIKQIAEKYSIKVEQPTTLKTKINIQKFEEYSCDLLVVMAYGMILPKEILDIPKLAPVNLHGSILPYYRGASPIHQALLNGDKKTGITAQYMVKKMDAGDILHIEELNIEEQDNYETLYIKMANIAAVCLEKVIKKLENNELKRIPQDESRVSYCSKITQEDGIIDWNKSATEIVNQIRAYFVWPHSYTYYNGKKIIIKEARLETNNKLVEGATANDISPSIDNLKKNIPGQIIKANKKALLIQTGSGMLSILKLQLEKKKAMDYKQFLNGFKLIEGEVLKKR